VVRLGDEWRDHPRRRLAAPLRLPPLQGAGRRLPERRQEIEALGGRLVFVGNGELIWARQFEAGVRAAGADRSRLAATGDRRPARLALDAWPGGRGGGIRAFRVATARASSGVPDQQGGVYVMLPAIGPRTPI